MNEKILIYTNQGQITEFQKEIKSAQLKCNNLITVFEAFQPWAKIQIIEQWYDLVNDPEKTFDQTMLKAIDLKASGGVTPSPEAVAKMFDIQRENYLNMVAGKPVIDPECKPCQKLKKIKGTTAITYSEYKSYESFLIFDSGSFTLNESRINEAKEKFNVYASTPKRVETYNFWLNVCSTLNALQEKNYVGIECLLAFQKYLQNRVMYSYATGKLHLNEEILMNEILKIN